MQHLVKKKYSTVFSKFYSKPLTFILQVPTALILPEGVKGRFQGNDQDSHFFLEWSLDIFLRERNYIVSPPEVTKSSRHGLDNPGAATKLASAIRNHRWPEASKESESQD